MTHGTETGYRYHKCRCDECVEGARAAWRIRRRQDRAKEAALPWRQRTHSRCAIVDEVAVQRAKHGERIQLSVVERYVAVRELTAAGVVAREIAVRLGISTRTVQRYRNGWHVMPGRAA